MPQPPADSDDRDRVMDERTAEAWQHLRHAKQVREELQSKTSTFQQLAAFFHAEVVENGMNARWRAAMDSVRE